MGNQMADKQQKLDTGGLLDILNGSTEINDILEKYAGNLAGPTLKDYLTDQIAMHGYVPADVIQKTNLSKSFVYQILAGTRVPNRDILLRISLAISLDLEETQKLLTLGRRGILYPKVRRDAAIIFCINRKFTLEQVNDLLCDIGESALIQGKV